MEKRKRAINLSYGLCLILWCALISACSSETPADEQSAPSPFSFQAALDSFYQADALAEMCQPTTLNDGTVEAYGFGVSMDTVNGEPTVGHGGFWGTLVSHFPERKLTVAISVNERDHRSVRPELLELTLQELDKHPAH